MLVAYFSHSGNTQAVAKRIGQTTGAELFQITPATAYPKDYDTVVDIAQVEKKKGSRPALAGAPADVSNHDTIFLGFPNWWSTMPMAVFTFLEGLDLAGKTIIPFCTHEGSGLGRSEQDLRTLCPRSKVLEGLAVRGSQATTSERAVKTWLDRLGILAGAR